MCPRIAAIPERPSLPDSGSLTRSIINSNVFANTCDDIGHESKFGGPGTSTALKVSSGVQELQGSGEHSLEVDEQGEVGTRCQP